MEVVIDQQAEKLSTSPEKSPLVGMASTAGSGSPGKPIDAVTEPGFSGAMEDESSRSSTESILTTTTNPCSDVTTNMDSEVVLTDDLVREEEKLAREGEKEEEEELKKRQQLWALMDEGGKEERYARLKFLLSKSNMYTEYLLGRMEEQKDLEKQRRERMMKRKENKEKKEQEKMKAQLGEEKQEASQENNDDESQTQTKSLSLRSEKVAATDSNIPKSPAVGVTAEEIKSPRRKLPAPKPKSAIVEATGSPAIEKENENPDVRQTRGSQAKGDNSPASVVEDSPSLRRGRKRKAAEDSRNLIVNFFQPTSKRKKAEPDGAEKKNKEIPKSEENMSPDKKTEENSDQEEDRKERKKKKSKKEEDEKFEEDPEPIIEEDGNVVRPALLMGGELRKYQVEGLNWLRVLYENGVNGILADEMGLGKTIQCIALIAHLGFNNIPGPFIVVAPLSTLPNWRSEFKKFAPRIPTLFYHGTYHERVKLLKKINRLRRVGKETYMRPVVITSYEMTIRDRKHLANYDWQLMIVDEGHRIKNTQCRLIKELRQYNNTHRLLLTGTPLQNNLAELWSLLNFILPEIFDDMGSFESWFDIAVISNEGADEAIVEAEQRKNVLSMLHQILMPFMLRRVKSDVDLMIPPKKELIVYAPMTLDQQEFYEATIDRTILQKIENRNCVKEVQELTDAGRPRRRSTKKKINYQAMMASENDAVVPKNKRKDEEELEAWVNEIWDYNNSCDAKEQKQKVSQVTIRLQNIMMQLRKCCNHPYLLEYPLDSTGQFKVDENVVSKCGKMLILDRMLAQLKQTGHKVLIFSQMTKMLDILEDFCIIREMKYCRLDGSCSVTDRQEQMESFNTDPEMFVFLLSTRAGGLGINLTAADTVIIYDSDWNPQCDLQAQDRCHRIGQTRPVVIYRFVTANTIDQKIVERAAAKRKLEKMIIHKGKFKTGIKNFSSEIKPLSPEELMDLLKSRDHCGEVHQGNDIGISDQELDMLLDRSDMYEEFEKSKGSTAITSKTDAVNSDSETLKSLEVKQTCKLFKEVDYVEGGSTRDLEPQGETSEEVVKDTTTDESHTTMDAEQTQKETAS